MRGLGLLVTIPLPPLQDVNRGAGGACCIRVRVRSGNELQINWCCVAVDESDELVSNARHASAADGHAVTDLVPISYCEVKTTQRKTPSVEVSAGMPSWIVIVYE